MEFEQLIREKGKCCISGKPMADTKHINMVQLQIPAAWEYPVWGNVITGIANMAVAFVHDDSIKDGELAGPIKFMVELQDSEIIYHPLRRCRVCGCTDNNCTQCIEQTGHPCSWVEEDLCSACI